MTSLKRARLASGLALKDAARQAGITPGYLSQLESRGSSALTWPRAVKLAAIYGTTTMNLIGGAVEREDAREVSRTKRAQGRRALMDRGSVRPR